MRPKIVMSASNLTDIDKQKIKELHSDPDLAIYSEETIQLMYSRGIRTKDDMVDFLICPYKNLENPAMMKDSDKFVNIVNDVIVNNGTIVFYTDYDMDGIGSAVTGVRMLNLYVKFKNSTSKIGWYANSRFVEGYGITPNGVEDLVTKYPDVKLIITTDNGIVGFQGVQKAKDLGLKIIVTDHHEPSKDGKMVNADAIIDPKRHDNLSKTPLCGAGVIFKLMLFLFQLNIPGWENFVYNYLDVVSLSTVADMVPLEGDNRIIVKQGLKKVNQNTNKHFECLMKAYNDSVLSESAKIIGIIDEEVFGFTYGPAFNALGRLIGTIDKAMEFFLGNEEERMFETAKEIFLNNQERKVITEDAINKMVDVVNTLYPTEADLPPIIALEDDDIHEGVIGLVATHIKDKYYRPTIIFTATKKSVIENGQKTIKTTYKGSARSIDGFDISEAFENVKHTLLGFGGHTMAAGLSVAPDKFEKFKTAICDYATPLLTSDILTPIINVDFALKVEDITLNKYEDLNEAAPFGQNFSKPMIGISNFMLDKRRYKTGDWNSVFVGENKQTVRLVDQTNFSAVMFKHRYRMDEIFDSIPDVNNYSLIGLKPIGYPRKKLFNNEYKVEFFVENDYLFKA